MPLTLALSLRERELGLREPSPRGRGWREAPGEGYVVARGFSRALSRGSIAGDFITLIADAIIELMSATFAGTIIDVPLLASSPNCLM